MQSVPETVTWYEAGADQERQRIRFLIDMRLKQLQDIPNLKNREQLSNELHRIRQYCDPC